MWQRERLGCGWWHHICPPAATIVAAMAMVPPLLSRKMFCRDSQWVYRGHSFTKINLIVTSFMY